MNKFDKVDEEIKKIEILYKYAEGCCISFIATDDLDIKEYIKKSILSIDNSSILDNKIVEYDFYKSKEKGLKNYNQLCMEQGNLIVATGFEEYAKYLTEKGIIQKEGKFYFNVFNMPRDSFYLKNKVRIILLVNQREYDMFLSEYGDDFTDYARYKTDIDIILKKESNRVDYER